MRGGGERSRENGERDMGRREGAWKGVVSGGCEDEEEERRGGGWRGAVSLGAQSRQVEAMGSTQEDEAACGRGQGTENHMREVGNISRASGQASWKGKS